MRSECKICKLRYYLGSIIKSFKIVVAVDVTASALYVASASSSSCKNESSFGTGYL